MSDARSWRRRGRGRPSPRRRRLAGQNEVFPAFDHTARGKGTGRLHLHNPGLRQAAAAVRRAVRNDHLPLYVSSGWVLLPPKVASLLSPLTFDLERRVLNHYPRCELPVELQSTASTWSQLRAFRRLYTQTRQAQPHGVLEE